MRVWCRAAQSRRRAARVIRQRGAARAGGSYRAVARCCRCGAVVLCFQRSSWDGGGALAVRGVGTTGSNVPEQSFFRLGLYPRSTQPPRPSLHQQRLSAQPPARTIMAALLLALVLSFAAPPSVLAQPSSTATISQTRTQTRSTTATASATASPSAPPLVPLSITEPTTVGDGGLVAASTLTVETGVSYSLTRTSVRVAGTLTVRGGLYAATGTTLVVGGEVLVLPGATFVLGADCVLNATGGMRVLTNSVSGVATLRLGERASLAAASLNVSGVMHFEGSGTAVRTRGDFVFNSWSTALYSSRLNISGALTLASSMNLYTSTTIVVGGGFIIQPGVELSIWEGCSVNVTGTALVLTSSARGAGSLRLRGDRAAFTAGSLNVTGELSSEGGGTNLIRTLGDFTYMSSTQDSAQLSYGSLDVGGVLTISGQHLSLGLPFSVRARDLVVSDGGGLFSQSQAWVDVNITNLMLSSGQIRLTARLNISGSLSVCSGAVSDVNVPFKCQLWLDVDPWTGLAVGRHFTIGPQSLVELFAGQHRPSENPSRPPPSSTFIRIGESFNLPADEKYWRLSINSGFAPLIFQVPGSLMVPSVSKGTSNSLGSVDIYGAVQLSAPNITIATGAVIRCSSRGNWLPSSTAVRLSGWSNVTHPWGMPDRCTHCAIFINASDTLVINGTVSVSGTETSCDGYNYATSKAGTVLIQTNMLLAAPGSRIDASKWDGGRVSVHCRSSPFASSTLSAWPLSINVQAGFGYSPCCGHYLGRAGIAHVACGTESPRVYVQGLNHPWSSGVAGSVCLPLPGFSSTRLEELVLSDTSGIDLPMHGVCTYDGLSEGVRGRVYVLQVQWLNSTVTRSDSSPGRIHQAPPENPALRYISPDDSDANRAIVMVQRANSTLYTSDTFATARFFVLAGTQLEILAASSEPRCGLACAEFASCVGYSFGTSNYAAAPLGQAALSAWGSMLSSTEPLANCVLFSNVTGLIPDMQSRSGVLRSAVPGGGAAAAGS